MKTKYEIRLQRDSDNSRIIDDTQIEVSNNYFEIKLQNPERIIAVKMSDLVKIIEIEKMVKE